MYTFFLTIDKVKLDGKPTKMELINVRNDICIKSQLMPSQPYQVHCFEYKDKGKKHERYLHYHTLLLSNRSFIPFKELKHKGYSIKLKKLITCKDILNTAGYINKLKKDLCDIEHIEKFLKKS